MTQGVLSFKYEEEKKDTGMTAMGIAGIEKHLHLKKQGWTDAQTVLSLILMNLAGGDCVEDLRRLEGDEGFCQVLRRIEHNKGMKRQERRRSGKLYTATKGTKPTSR